MRKPYIKRRLWSERKRDYLKAVALNDIAGMKRAFRELNRVTINKGESMFGETLMYDDLVKRLYSTKGENR